MKSLSKTAALGALVALALCSALYAPSSDAKPTATRDRCFAYPKDQTLRGYFLPGIEHEMFRWTTGCTSPTSTSITGDGWLAGSLERLENGHWKVLAKGLHLYAIATPGTYRVVVRNESQTRAYYTMRHGHGIG